MSRFWKSIILFMGSLALVTAVQISAMNYQTDQAMQSCERVKMVSIWGYECFE